VLAGRTEEIRARVAAFLRRALEGARSAAA